MLKGYENNNSNFLDKTDARWLIAYIILGVAVYFIIPFPLSLLVSLGLILLMMMVVINTYIIKKFKIDENNSNNNSSKNRDSGIRRMFNSLSLSLYDDPRAIFEHNPLKFYCMWCGKEHKKRKCPGCGSMAVRVG